LRYNPDPAVNYDYQSMAQLKSKSEKNVTAAEVLLKNDCYSSVPHPAYYSCLQLMKHFLCHKEKIDYDTQVNEIKKKDGKSHQYYIEEIYYAIIDRKNIHEAGKFLRNIQDLKALREEADYTNVIINPSKAQSSIDRAKYTIDFLKKIFK
jgi:uncharacterized protein (UPF0332 family)